ncbi:MAG: isochorismatase family protein [Parasphingorhabdus sp.]
MNELEDNYQTAGFGGSLQLGNRPALVLVDLARAYIDSSSPLYLGDESAFLANIELVAAARDAGIPVIFTRVEYMPGGSDGGLFYRKVSALSLFQKGEPMAEFDPRLRPEAEDIIVTKQYPSAFFGTSLAATLTAMGINSCIISGFSTSGCVRASALDALQNGFVPIVVSDACGDRDPAVQNANLFDLGAKYAEVISLAATKTYLSSI